MQLEESRLLQLEIERGIQEQLKVRVRIFVFPLFIIFRTLVYTFKFVL